MFNKNSYVVYRKDVCKIKDIKEKFGEEYYILIPISDHSLKIEIPTSNKNGYLRDILPKEEVLNLIQKIPEIEALETEDKYIETEYKNKLKDATHEDLISIIKTTYLRNHKRELEKKKKSDKDQTYFEKAEQYLYNEFSIALNMNYEDTKEFVIEKVKELINE